MPNGPRDVNKHPFTKYGDELHNGDLRKKRKEK